MRIEVGTRESPLAVVQVREVLEEIRIYAPSTEFTLVCARTIGDRDRSSSLKMMDKTDFFTREIDDLLLDKRCRAAVHSAKDLPDPIREGLRIAAITQGVDPSDSLVFRKGESLEMLPSGAKIAASSIRREQAVRALREDLVICEVRGTIQERLRKLEDGSVDGIVVAEAALLRLGLSPDRISIPGDSAPFQGKLAVVCREDDEEMIRLFAPLHDMSLPLPELV